MTTLWTTLRLILAEKLLYWAMSIAPKGVAEGHDLGWLYPEQAGSERNPDFLAYCYVRQLAPAFNFGGTGLFSDDIWKLGQQAP